MNSINDNCYYRVHLNAGRISFICSKENGEIARFVGKNGVPAVIPTLTGFDHFFHFSLSDSFDTIYGGLPGTFDINHRRFFDSQEEGVFICNSSAHVR